MKNIADLAHALVFAEECHRGHIDKSGRMYILHPLRVMRQMDSETEKIVGVLHDVVEDTPITFQILKEKGYSQEIRDATDSLTKRKSPIPRNDVLTKGIKDVIEEGSQEKRNTL